MNDFYTDPNEWVENDPARATAAIATAAAQQALEANFGQVLQAAWEAGAAQNAGLVQAQSESAILEADRALNAKYSDWQEIREDVGAYIQEHPEVLPESIAVSPQALANRLDDVTKIVREDARERRERQAFDRIKNAGALSYIDLMAQRPSED
jgi:hypothetical protein